MKKYLSQFLLRGLVAFGFGPIILAVLYLVLHHQGIVETLTVREVCLGIISLSALAFIVGGMNFIYQIERLPLMAAIAIHGAALYVSYLVTYLLNNWLEHSMIAFLAFTGIFALGYLIIWAIIYAVTKRNTDHFNKILRQKQQNRDADT